MKVENSFEISDLKAPSILCEKCSESNSNYVLSFDIVAHN